MKECELKAYPRGALGSGDLPWVLAGEDIDAGGDADDAIKMNRFAPLVMRYLMDLGEQGDLITTLPTSHMGPDYAAAKGQKA